MPDLDMPSMILWAAIVVCSRTVLPESPGPSAATHPLARRLHAQTRALEPPC
jgi:hypothetical protein